MLVCLRSTFRDIKWKEKKKGSEIEEIVDKCLDIWILKHKSKLSDITHESQTTGFEFTML